MLELEVKVLNIDVVQMEKKLVDLGAEFIDKEEQVNMIIDKEDNYIENKLNAYLRIRETTSLLDGKKIKHMTFKKQEKQEKIRVSKETTAEIKDIKNMLEILNSLGYKIVKEGFKKRISYRIGGIRFDIDQWDENTYPNPYLEIEVNKEEDLEKAIKLLNINKQNITTKSIVELQKDLI